MQRPRMKMKMKYCIINDYLFCKNGSSVFSKVEIVQFLPFYNQLLFII